MDFSCGAKRWDTTIWMWEKFLQEYPMRHDRGCLTGEAIKELFEIYDTSRDRSYLSESVSSDAITLENECSSSCANMDMNYDSTPFMKNWLIKSVPLCITGNPLTRVTSIMNGNVSMLNGKKYATERESIFILSRAIARSMVRYSISMRYFRLKHFLIGHQSSLLRRYTLGSEL